MIGSTNEYILMSNEYYEQRCQTIVLPVVNISLYKCRFSTEHKVVVCIVLRLFVSVHTRAHTHAHTHRHTHTRAHTLTHSHTHTSQLNRQRL